MSRALRFKKIRVSDKGQIAIPTEIRKEMSIHKGDELLLIKKGDKIILEKSRKFERKLEDEFKDIERMSEESLKTLWSNKEDDIWNSYLLSGKRSAK